MNSHRSVYDQSGKSLIKLTFAGETTYIVSITDSEDSSTKFILTLSGQIAGSDDPNELLRLIIENNTLQIPEIEATRKWAALTLQKGIGLTDDYDLDALLVTITNKGLTRASIEGLGYFINLVNDYCWQTNNDGLGNLLELPSVKKLWLLYSDYVFWESIPRSITLEEQIGSLDRHLVKSNLTKLIASFIKCIATD